MREFCFVIDVCAAALQRHVVLKRNEFYDNFLKFEASEPSTQSTSLKRIDDSENPTRTFQTHGV